MNRLAFCLSWIVFACAAIARAEPIDLWLDVDTAIGVIEDGRARDVDDGLAIVQALRSPAVRVRGVSVVYGNASLPRAIDAARAVLSRFDSTGLVAHVGAASADDLGTPTDASRALAAELKQRRLTVAALGPLTNVATVLMNEPELAKQIDNIVICAGRRVGFGFHLPGDPTIVFPDFNFEKDAKAMKVLLDSGVPIVFAGYEASCDTWISRADLETIAAGGENGKWISQQSQAWITRWETMRGPKGFNPFDTVTLAAVIHPQWCESIAVTAVVTSGPDDRAAAPLAADRPTKPYLICMPDESGTSPHRYVTRVAGEFAPELVRLLAAD